MARTKKGSKGFGGRQWLAEAGFYFDPIPEDP
jgi:hypothetical protein